MDKQKSTFRMYNRLLINLKSQIFLMIEDGHNADTAYQASSTALAMLIGEYLSVYVKPNQYDEVLTTICSQVKDFAGSSESRKTKKPPQES